MTSNLVVGLRELAGAIETGHFDVTMTDEPEIRRIRKSADEIERQRAALEQIKALGEDCAFDCSREFYQGRSRRMLSIAREALSGVAPVETTAPQGESGWLIELSIKGVPHWLMVSSVREWTSDANKAVRFAREGDADAMLFFLGLEDAKATGHEWVAPSPVEPSRDDTEDMANIGRALMARLPKDYHWSDCPTEIVTDLQNEIHDLRRADYEEVLADHRRLVRELDVLLNGEDGAAKQASLCDIVGQLRTRAPSREVFDRYPVGTLFQKKSDGRVLAMTPDSSGTVIAIQPENGDGL